MSPVVVWGGVYPWQPALALSWAAAPERVPRGPFSQSCLSMYIFFFSYFHIQGFSYLDEKCHNIKKVLPDVFIYAF